MHSAKKKHVKPQQLWKQRLLPVRKQQLQKRAQSTPNWLRMLVTTLLLQKKATLLPRLLRKKPLTTLTTKPLQRKRKPTEVGENHACDS